MKFEIGTSEKIEERLHTRISLYSETFAVFSANGVTEFNGTGLDHLQESGLGNVRLWFC